MVLYKRKAVSLYRSPFEPDGDAEVWHIPITDEYFIDYDDYLKRIDYYSERKFICELTGHSCLTYFEAIDSEKTEANEIIQNFPEPLKEPILRQVQFSQISRLDALVDEVYNALRQDFYPGEIVIAKTNDLRIKVIVREKAKFNAITLPTGAVRPEFSRYRVQLASDPLQEMPVDHTQLIRDRKRFTKVILRTFIKHAVSRDSWLGAPWIVKDEYASKYRIDTEMPGHLLRQNPHAAQQEEKQKKWAARNKARLDRLSTIAEQKAKTQERRAQKKAHMLELKAEADERKRSTKAAAALANLAANGSNSGVNGDGEHKNKSHHKSIIQEDLQFTYNPAVTKPPLKPYTVLPPEHQNLVGVLLEIWLFLNTYHKPLVLDVFTFDDFVDVLRLATADDDCPLLDEIHCALLSLVVNTNSSELAISVPFVEGDDNEEEEGEEEDEGVNDEANGVPEVNGSTEDERAGDNEENGTQDAMDVDADDEGDVDDEDDAEEEVADEAVDEDQSSHRAASFMMYQKVDWKERLRKRMFKDGGWQQILISLLNTVSYVPWWEETCEEALKLMASLDRPVTLASARSGYFELPFELRIKVLEILCNLLYGTAKIRTYIDQCMEQSTKIRKDRMDRQREHKLLAETVKALEEEMKKYFAKVRDGDASESPVPEEDDNEKAQKHKEQEQELLETNEKFKELHDKHRVAEDRMEEISVLNKQAEEDLIELDCQRLRLLGKDRFYNRYWWCEHNGMKRPVPREDVLQMLKPKAEPDVKEEQADGDSEDLKPAKDESEEPEMAINDIRGRSARRRAEQREQEGEEAEEDKNETVGYSMGRLWVQGPTDEEIRVYLNGPLPTLDVSDGSAEPVSTSTGLESKRSCEGSTTLESADSWAYYDDPADIEALLKWLNIYGRRESKLIKELSNAKSHIVSSLVSRQEDLKLDAENEHRQVEEQLKKEFPWSEEDEANSREETPVSDDESEEEFGSVKRKRGRGRKDVAVKKSQRGRRSQRLTSEDIKELKQQRLEKMEARRKELVDELAKEVPERATGWSNSAALEELGHTHYEGPQRKRGGKPRRK